MQDQWVAVFERGNFRLAGQQALISWTVSNNGDATAQGPWPEEILLAGDAQGDNAQSIAQITYSGELPAGASIVRSAVVTLPSNYSGQGWFVVAEDLTRQLHEDPNTPNALAVAAAPTTISTPTSPDLIVSSVKQPTEAFAGQTTQVSWVVSNVGDGATSTPNWSDNVYLSLNRTLDTSAIFLGSFGNPSYLAAGSSYQNSATVAIPRGLSGNYYIVVTTNSGGKVAESNTGNDMLASSEFRVAPPPLPQLTVQTVRPLGPLFSGQAIPLGWQVTNTGDAVTGNATWTDHVYLSQDGALDSSAVLLGTVDYSGNLQPGASYSQTASIVLPVGVSGNETFFVVSNAGGQVYELGDPKSFAASTTANVNLTPPPDLQASLSALPGGPVTAHTLAVTYTVANDGASATPNSFWNDAVYISTSPTLDGAVAFGVEIGLRRPPAA